MKTSTVPKVSLLKLLPFLIFGILVIGAVVTAVWIGNLDGWAVSSAGLTTSRVGLVNGSQADEVAGGSEDSGNQDRASAILLVGGRVFTQGPAGVIEADVLVENGMIQRVGQNLRAPRHVRRIDARGMMVTPGLIDAQSALWTTGAAGSDDARDGSLNILDAVDIYDDSWEEAAARGVTAVYVQPGAGVLGGKGAVLSVGPVSSLEDLLLLEDAALHGSIGSESNYETIKGVLEGAKKYGEAWKKYREFLQEKSEKEQEEAAAVETRRGGRTGRGQRAAGQQATGERRAGQRTAGRRQAETAAEASQEEQQVEETVAEPNEPEFDAVKEVVLRVLEREVPLRLKAEKEEDLQFALTLADEFKICLVIEGAFEAHELTDDLAGRNVKYVLGPMFAAPAAPAQPAAMNDALRQIRRQYPGIQIPAPAAAPAPTAEEKRPDEWPTSVTGMKPVWALGTFSTADRDARLLRLHAAEAVALGVNADEVLKAMTSGAAQVLGVADQVGSIETGKRADIVVFNGHPTDPATAVRIVLVGGQVVYEDEGAGAIAAGGEVVSKVEFPKVLPSRYALQSSRVLNESGQFGPMVILVEDGKIVRASNSRRRMRDVPVFDLGDAVVTPGLIQGHTDLGLGGEISQEGKADACYLRAADAYFPVGNKAGEALQKEGFLAALLAPGDRNVLAGVCAVVRFDETSERGKYLVKADAGQKIVMSAGSRVAERFPVSLYGQVEFVSSALEGEMVDLYLYHSEAIQAQIDAERKQNMRSMQNGNGGRAFVVVENDLEVRAVLGLIDQYSLPVVLVGAAEVKGGFDRIKSKTMGIIAKAPGLGEFDRTFDSLVKASKAGVPVAFGFGKADEIRQAASRAVGLGMSRAAALKGLTSYAALLLGVEDQLGTIGEGYRADLVIWSGSPLDLRSEVKEVIVEGKVVRK